MQTLVDFFYCYKLVILRTTVLLNYYNLRHVYLVVVSLGQQMLPAMREQMAEETNDEADDGPRRARMASKAKQITMFK